MKRLKPSEAKRLHGYDQGDWKDGIVNSDLAGSFCKFKSGERVKVRIDKPRTVTVQRVKWRGSLVPLANVLHSVPRWEVRILPPKS